VPPLYAASSYGTGTTVVVDWTTVTDLVVVADWTIVVDRVPLVYTALQVLAYCVMVISSARASLLSRPTVRKIAAALRTNIFAPGAGALLLLRSSCGYAALDESGSDWWCSSLARGRMATRLETMKVDTVNECKSWTR